MFVFKAGVKDLDSRERKAILDDSQMGSGILSESCEAKIAIWP